MDWVNGHHVWMNYNQPKKNLNNSSPSPIQQHRASAETCLFPKATPSRGTPDMDSAFKGYCRITRMFNFSGVTSEVTG